MFGIEDLELPSMHDAVLVAAFSGWVDSGYCGQGAVRHLAAHAPGASEAGVVDLSAIVDLLANRPEIRVIEGQVRRLDWPEIEVVTARAGRDVVVLSGPEPALGWRDLIGELCALARRCDVTEAYVLGGMPAAVSHRDPVLVLGTATDAALGARLGALRPDYVGPTGLQTALQVALGERGIPAAGLWAQVPAYTTSIPSAPGVHALLLRLRAVTGIEVDLSALSGQVERWRTQVQELLARRPELAELVDRLHEMAERSEVGELPLSGEDMASGEDLASEIERYLRDQG